VANLHFDGVHYALHSPSFLPLHSGIGILRRYGPGCRVSDGLGARHHIFDFVRAPVLKRGNQMEGMPLREV